MPRGKYVNHKGKNRHFTSPEELEEDRKNEEMKKKWRQKHDESSEEEEEEAAAASASGSGEDSEEDSDDENHKAKGVQGLIEIENPNRVHKKTAEKVSKVDPSASKGPELSRREREEIEKQKAQANYQKLHAQGKTDQAKADLARLAIIRQQREEAAKRREEEKKKEQEKAKK